MHNFGQSKQLSQALDPVYYTSADPRLRPTKGEGINFHELNGNEVGPSAVPKFGQPDKMLGAQKLEIRETPSDLNEDFDMLENTTPVAFVGSHGITTIPVAQSGASSAPPLQVFHITLIVPRFILLSGLYAPACQRLIKRAFSPDEFRSLIEAVFSSTDEDNLVRCLRGEDAQAFVDVADEVCSPFTGLEFWLIEEPFR